MQFPRHCRTTNVFVLLENDDVEAWLIATPTPTHPDLVTAALGAGLHVLCEKPLSMDPNQSEELGDVVEEII